MLHATAKILECLRICTFRNSEMITRDSRTSTKQVNGIFVHAFIDCYDQLQCIRTDISVDWRLKAAEMAGRIYESASSALETCHHIHSFPLESIGP